VAQPGGLILGFALHLNNSVFTRRRYTAAVLAMAHVSRSVNVNIDKRIELTFDIGGFL